MNEKEINAFIDKMQKVKRHKHLSEEQKKKMKAVPSHIINIEQCPRCGKNHGDMEFIPLLNPSIEYGHWAMCPQNIEPLILLKTTSQFLQ